MDKPEQFKEVVDLISWNIDNLARHGLVTKKDLPMFGAILKVLIINNKNVDAIWAMSKLLNTDDEGIEILASENMIEPLINLLAQNITNRNLRIPLVKSISLIMTSESDGIMN